TLRVPEAKVAFDRFLLLHIEFWPGGPEILLTSLDTLLTADTQAVINDASEEVFRPSQLRLEQTISQTRHPEQRVLSTKIAILAKATSWPSARVEAQSRSPKAMTSPRATAPSARPLRKL